MVQQVNLMRKNTSIQQQGRQSSVNFEMDHTHYLPSPGYVKEIYEGQQRTKEHVRLRFDERRKILETACEMYGNSTKFQRRSRSLLTLPKLNTYYCPITKCGSTTWKRLLTAARKMLQQNKAESKEDFSSGAHDPSADFFVFVREPYSRLLSAYVDKLFSPNTMYWNRMGKYVISKFRQNASAESLQCGHDVTFGEFIKYFIHSQTHLERRDIHIIPMHDFCSFCQRPYRYVGHLETFSEDMPFILNAIKSPVNYTADFDNTTIVNRCMHVRRTRARIEECMSFNEAGRRVWKMWQMRGVIGKWEPFPFKRENVSNIDIETFQNAGLQALSRSRSQASRKSQRSEAFAEAFGSVPLEDRLLLKELLFLDFKLFGFDPSLPDVFLVKNSRRNATYKYFSTEE